MAKNEIYADDLDPLRARAKELGIKVHHSAGDAKIKKDINARESVMGIELTKWDDEPAEKPAAGVSVKLVTGASFSSGGLRFTKGETVCVPPELAGKLMKTGWFEKG